MAIVRISREAKLELLRDPVGRNPADSAECRIGYEEATDCEGVRCGERLELMLPAEEYRQYIERHGERSVVRSHLVCSGDNPPARARYYAIFKTAPNQ